LNLFFEDELMGVSKINKNMLCGAITGAVYKSTLGVVPAAVGFVLGGTLIGSMTKIVDNLNQRGIVAFEMKF
jgi:import inner membrane translocase subunit TIM23